MYDEGGCIIFDDVPPQSENEEITLYVAMMGKGDASKQWLGKVN